MRIVEDERAQHGTPYITIRAAHPRSQIQSNQLAVQYVIGENRNAVLLTKPLPKDIVANSRNRLMSTVVLCFLSLCPTGMIADPIFDRSNFAVLRQSDKRALETPA